MQIRQATEGAEYIWHDKAFQKNESFLGPTGTALKGVLLFAYKNQSYLTEG